ncbi:MAG: DUF86 domain-containing protein [Candidatus Aenigmatarchaeota archaeon]
MEDIRKRRYVEKITLIEKRIHDINTWKEDFFEEEKSKLACYKAMQEIIEACMDIVSMVLKDDKRLLKDDYTNIDALEKMNFCSKDVCSALRELNGLRNRIIHEYNGLDDRIAIESIDDLIPDIHKFLEAVKKWLEKKQ